MDHEDAHEYKSRHPKAWDEYTSDSDSQADTPEMKPTDIVDEVVKPDNTSKEVSNWYRHDFINLQHYSESRWSEFRNVDDEEEDLKSRTSLVPIIHRHKYEQKNWVTASVTIQDPAMRDVLTEVLHNYQDLDLDIQNWTFEPPFMPLVHRWEELNQYPENSQEATVKDSASTLLAFLTPVLDSSVVSIAQTRKTGKVNFTEVWQIFSPGSLVITKFLGMDTVCRVLKYKEVYDRGILVGWTIDVEYVDWNGEKTGFSTTEVTIWGFGGLRRVNALPVFPISFLEDEENTKARMIQRGRKFERLRGYYFMVSNGTKFLLETENPEQRPVAGKVCIDAYAYYRSCNKVKPKLRPLSSEDGEEVEVHDEQDASIARTHKLASDNPWGDNEDATKDVKKPDTPYEARFSNANAGLSSATKGPAERVHELRSLTDEQCLMATPWMKGFDMKTKDWCELNVDELTEVVWNDKAFEKLVLPEGEKDLAWEFVESKSLAKEAAFDDFVPDKGRGLIILMFGPPGVGKTFTAEAVAERSRVPLYSMSAGDLGIKPTEVEKNLERALELCRMWNAMLLLDEADVFLGARTNESLARNELVSIFLTKLEYYPGILFLTTNRATSIDHAFQSRVDMFLPYHDLTPEARLQVWSNFIDQAGRDKFEIDEQSLEKLSQLKLNGREIKNLIKSAQLLSRKTGGKVPIDRLYMLAEKRRQALTMVGN